MNEKRNLKFTLTVTQVLLSILIFILIYFVYIYSNSEKVIDTEIQNVKSNDGLLSFIKDPVFIAAIFSLLVTYLFLDRWKNIESRVDSLTRDQRKAIDSIEEKAEKKFDDKVDKMIDRAETIDKKVSSLIESHPWIGLITENDIIPDIPTCHVVLNTSEKLLNLTTVKRSLVQEYIYYWVGKREKKNDMQLEGTSEDFLKLVYFCEEELKDKYLSFLVLQAGYDFTKILSPFYLKQLIDYGKIQEASKVVSSLKYSIKTDSFSKFIAIFKDRGYENADYKSRCLAGIGLFESIKGREKKSKLYIAKATEAAKQTKAKDYVTYVESEIDYYKGEYDSARAKLNTINLSTASNEIKKNANELTERMSYIELGNSIKLDMSELEKTSISVETSIKETISENIEKHSETEINKKVKSDVLEKDLESKKSKQISDTPNIGK